MSIGTHTVVSHTGKLGVGLPGLGVPGLTIMEGHAGPQLIYPLIGSSLFPAHYHVGRCHLEGVLVKVTDIVVHLLSNLGGMSIRSSHKKQLLGLASHYRNRL